MLDRTKTDPLADLVRRIDAEHNAVGIAFNSALAHAISAGEMLIEAKRQVKQRDKGKWLPWLKANCSVPARTASHYMTLASPSRRPLLSDENGNTLPISVRHALRLFEHRFADEGDSEWGEYAPKYDGWIEPGEWHYEGWDRSFVGALQSATQLPNLHPPACRFIVKAAREGKTPGLTGPVLRKTIALLTGYAEALERPPKDKSTYVAPIICQGCGKSSNSNYKYGIVGKERKEGEFCKACHYARRPDATH